MSHSGSARAKSGSGEKKEKQTTNGHQQKKNNKEEEVSSANDDDDEPIRAPIQLKIEFVNSIMFRQWEVAKKLCQFMLMYEPDNQEAKQYAPLIDYMLSKEQSSSSSSSDDSSDDDSSGSDSSSSSSSNEEEEEKKPVNDVNSKASKPVNGSASSSNKCPYHK